MEVFASDGGSGVGGGEGNTVTDLNQGGEMISSRGGKLN